MSSDTVECEEKVSWHRCLTICLQPADLHRDNFKKMLPITELISKYIGGTVLARSLLEGFLS